MKGKVHLVYTGADRRITLKWILQKLGRGLDSSAGLGAMAGSCEQLKNYPVP
jgi:hypothetical protein